MADRAPEIPTTHELASMYPLENSSELEIAMARSRVSDLLIGESSGLVAILGPCAMTGEVSTIKREGESLADMTMSTEGLMALHRMPPWKPRTNPEDWHGEETTNPTGAYATVVRQAILESGVSIEFGMKEHIERYGPMITFGWIGGRNIHNSGLMDAVATQAADIPLGVKNGLDGDITPALGHITRLQELRRVDDAAVVLLYRGGENAQDPVSWERNYREALVRTGGRMVVDVAHGSEMAHDPNRRFKKSYEGQRAALEHVIDIAETYGEMPRGIMAEASEAHSPTDPHMPFEEAIARVSELHKRAMRSTSDMAAV